MAVFIKNDSAFKKNVGAFEAKRRGVKKKRLGAGNSFGAMTASSTPAAYMFSLQNFNTNYQKMKGFGL